MASSDGRMAVIGGSGAASLLSRACCQSWEDREDREDNSGVCARARDIVADSSEKPPYALP